MGAGHARSVGKQGLRSEEARRAFAQATALRPPPQEHHRRKKELDARKQQRLAVQAHEREQRRDRVQLHQTYEEFHRRQQVPSPERPLLVWFDFFSPFSAALSFPLRSDTSPQSSPPLTRPRASSSEQERNLFFGATLRRSSSSTAKECGRCGNTRRGPPVLSPV